jgi:hypothetical protein
MKKVLKHLKNNAIIYLVLLTCAVVIVIATFIKPAEELKEVDTSLFEVVNINQTIKLFNDDSTKFLIIGNNTDQTTVSYAEYVRYSMLKHNYKPYFMYQEDIDFKKDTDKVEKLGELLDISTNYKGESTKAIDLIKEDVVPLTIIIKNRKPIYIFIGTLDTSTLDTLVEAYGVNGKGDEIESA